MKVRIDTIPHTSQRYPTVGDWQISNDPVTGEPIVLVTVSSLEAQVAPMTTLPRAASWPQEALVAVHELIEAVLCLRAGVYQEQVDEFDILFEKLRQDRTRRRHVLNNGHLYPKDLGIMCEALAQDEEMEPGDCYAAPYYHEHQLATSVERMMAAKMDVPWTDYEANLDALYGTDDNPPANLP